MPEIGIKIFGKEEYVEVEKREKFDRFYGKCNSGIRKSTFKEYQTSFCFKTL